ncbi:hypothetical protein [Burkholderia ubonensis]|uniref:hypothetical protein n=1 Tax=Burkholderia ubonensis TaxID=101571 RepID=UPI00075EA488|nr:hypothetical protein [Burkholderia ubonensis]AOK62892.1 hypothetical protein WM29_28000 [Burkholderia ubonensis]KVS43555.1 hypothetical protein WK38_25580 [Burkholderia ubonensis]KVS50141.1 hypothetical protein WK37_04455 [Burkholderia ubonensis]KVS82720.1 hypothetical protein WK42_10540 [Burkholderia ubonensis]KVS86222.1 hypothetical protein WK44_20595 [Burkholderia ubonensis]
MNYNSLYVPLDIGTWQCMLVLAREYYSLGGGFWDPFASTDERQERVRQIEDDRRAFDLYFRPSYDFRQLIATEIDAITSFLSHHLDVPHWNLPTSNDDIEHTLKRAVADGRLVPVVNRGRCLPAQTFRPTPAPLRWPSSGGGSAIAQTMRYAGGLSADVSGAPALAGETVVSVDDDGRGLDWLSMADALAAAAHASGERTQGSAAATACDVSKRLGDAQPFDYPGALPGDAEQIAATNRSDMMACDIITSECKGSVLREFPGQYLKSTLGEIQGDANDGVKDARKALKLLNDNRFKK